MKEDYYGEVNYKVGKSASENWQLLGEDEEHTWFHLENGTSPHVIMNMSLADLEFKCKNKMLPLAKENYLTYGALLCKNNSKERNDPKSSVIYTSICNLKKGKVTGQVTIINENLVQKITARK